MLETELTPGLRSLRSAFGFPLTGGGACGLAEPAPRPLLEDVALPQASLPAVDSRLPPTGGGACGLAEPAPRPLLEDVAPPQASLPSVGYRLPPTGGGACGLAEPAPRPLLGLAVLTGSALEVAGVGD